MTEQELMAQLAVVNPVQHGKLVLLEEIQDFIFKKGKECIAEGENSDSLYCKVESAAKAQVLSQITDFLTQKLKEL